MTRLFASLALTTCAILTLAACQRAPAPQAAAVSVRDTNSNQWLSEADNDALRFQRLEYYLAGFSPSMWEAGARYTRLHEALQRENYDLALYHWDKIRDVIERGVTKRPGRRANAEAILLNTVWPQVKTAFESRNRETARDGFAMARSACLACHIAENVPFMNDQALFSDLIP